MRALLKSLRRSTRAIPAREQAEAVQMGQDGTYTMGKNTFERLDELSQENRQKLREQIKRVQAEAKQLRAQARHLNRARHAEAKKTQKIDGTVGTLWPHLKVEYVAARRGCRLTIEREPESYA